MVIYHKLCYLCNRSSLCSKFKY